MGNSYSMTSAVSAMTTVPFIQVASPSATAVEILSFYISQQTSETSEQASLSFTRRTTNSTFPAAATAPSPVALSKNAPATQLVTGTTQNAISVSTATGSLNGTLGRYSFNTLNGFVHLPLPEERITVGPNGFLTVQFVVAPAANDYNITMTFREL